VIRFQGVLTATPRGGGGTLVPVPKDVAAKLGLKGMPKIQAVIAGTPYRGSLMPMGDGTYCLGVLKSIQQAAASWSKLSFTNKKEMAASLEGAKKAETRERRLKAAVEKLIAG
jgi:hypothetical protein